MPTLRLATSVLVYPKQELFVAPMWTPEREDLLIELCGEIDDEDTSLLEREDRFLDYKDTRISEAECAQEAASRIADNIISLPHMENGGLDAQVFALYSAPGLPAGKTIKQTMSMAGTFFDAASTSNGKFVLVETVKGLREAVASGRKCGMLAVEGGHIIEGDLNSARLTIGSAWPALSAPSFLSSPLRSLNEASRSFPLYSSKFYLET
jgi:hypothetical protein